VFKAFGLDAIAIPNDVDPRDFHYRVRRKLEPTILVPRALEANYNVACALRAFRIVQEQYPDARLTVLGTGPLRKQLEQTARDLKLRNATFAGRVQRDAIADCFDEHDILLNSSSVDNMPVSLLEAFAAGLP